MLSTIFLKMSVAPNPLYDFPTFGKDSGREKYFPIIRRTTEQMDYASYTEHSGELDCPWATSSLSPVWKLCILDQHVDAMPALKS